MGVTDLALQMFTGSQSFEENATEEEGKGFEEEGVGAHLQYFHLKS